MKCQILFSRKIKKNISLLSAEFAHNMVSVMFLMPQHIRIVSKIHKEKAIVIHKEKAIVIHKEKAIVIHKKRESHCDS